MTLQGRLEGRKRLAEFSQTVGSYSAGIRSLQRGARRSAVDVDASDGHDEVDSAPAG